MNTILQCRNLQIQVNRFKNGNKRKPDNGTPFSAFVQRKSKIRLNSSINDVFLSTAGKSLGSIRHTVNKWNLEGVFCAILHTIYQFAIRPLMMLLMRNFGILTRRVEKKLTALQEYFYGKMEDLFNHEEPGDYLFKMQCTNGQQVEYQYEIAWVERTFDIIQVVNYVMLNINHKILATFEKAQIKFYKFQNRHHAAQFMEMPEFEITNPEIFDYKPSEILASEMKSRVHIASLPIQNMIKTTLQQNVKFFLSLENRFSTKKPESKSQHQWSNNQSAKNSIDQPDSIFQNITNQLLNSEISGKIKQHLKAFKVKCFSRILHLKYYRKL